MDPREHVADVSAGVVRVHLDGARHPSGAASGEGGDEALEEGVVAGRRDLLRAVLAQGQIDRRASQTTTTVTNRSSLPLLLLPLLLIIIIKSSCSSITVIIIIIKRSCSSITVIIGSSSSSSSNISPPLPCKLPAREALIWRLCTARP